MNTGGRIEEIDAALGCARHHAVGVGLIKLTHVLPNAVSQQSYDLLALRTRRAIKGLFGTRI